MNTNKKKSNTNNNTFINKILMDSLTKKKNFLNYTTVVYPNINSIIKTDGVSSPILEGTLTPSFLQHKNSSNVEINKSDSISTVDLIKNLDSIKSQTSVQSSSTEISDYESTSPLVLKEENTNSMFKNIILNKLKKEEYEDSELIMDTNIMLNINKNKIDKINQNKKEQKINNDYNNTHIYDIESNDFLIISNLILISKLEPKQKLFVNYSQNFKNSVIPFELKIDDSYIPKLSRWYYSQNRNDTISALEKLIDVSIEQFTMHRNMNNTVDVKKYFYIYKNSLIGLNNLKITYCADEITSKGIENIIEKIKNVIDKN
jgi:hypothetical protein